MIFSEPIELQNPNEIRFDEMPLWDQFHNLPLAFMQPLILRSLEKRIGKVIEVDADD